MAGVYFQIRAESAKTAVQCGLKLSEHADRLIRLPGCQYPQKVMTAWLHPEDLPKKETGMGQVCLHLELDPSRCYVGDEALYSVGLCSGSVMELYLESLVKLKNYHFGSYRAPGCLIPLSVLDTQINVLGKALDYPIPYENSAAMYLRAQTTKLKDALKDEGNALLFSWCLALESKGLVERFEDDKGQTVVFVSKGTGKTLILKTPEEDSPGMWP